jgi:hypothetical protein
MLTIRREQQQAFTQAALQRFENEMVAHLRASFPDQAGKMEEAELRALIRASIEVAAKYGVNEEFDVRRYLEYVFCYGPDFGLNSRTTWAGEILCNSGLTGAEKMNRIDDCDAFLLRPREF